MYNFDAKKTTQDIILWIKDFFEKNGKDCKAVIGISGGKDSTITAKLCVEALGKDRVYAVFMPNGYDDGNYYDVNMARKVIKYLNIDSIEIDISRIINDTTFNITSGIRNNTPAHGDHNDCFILSEQARINLPSKIRMSVLYAVSQSVNGRVANTYNLSEDWIGYSTRYDDSVGDFSPLSRLTANEVKQIGKELGLPTEFVDKVPSDGLCDKTDEDNLGFTYAVLDEYIRTGICEDPETKALIDRKHETNKFKLEPMPCFEYKVQN